MLPIAPAATGRLLAHRSSSAPSFGFLSFLPPRSLSSLLPRFRPSSPLELPRFFLLPPPFRPLFLAYIFDTAASESLDALDCERGEREMARPLLTGGGERDRDREREREREREEEVRRRGGVADRGEREGEGLDLRLEGGEELELEERA